VYGTAYCIAGVSAGFSAVAIGGWFSVLLWLIAILLVGVGLWTILFLGFWISIIHWAKRRDPTGGSEQY
jgi:hypothetical protein